MCVDLIDSGADGVNGAFGDVIANITTVCEVFSDFLPEEETPVGKHGLIDHTSMFCYYV